MDKRFQVIVLKFMKIILLRAYHKDCLGCESYSPSEKDCKEMLNLVDMIDEKIKDSTKRNRLL